MKIVICSFQEKKKMVHKLIFNGRLKPIDYYYDPGCDFLALKSTEICII